MAKTDVGPASDAAPQIGDVRNLGEPLRFTEVEDLCGVSAEAGRGGQQVKIWTKLAVTSDERVFHRVMEGLEGAIRHMGDQAGLPVQLGRSSTALLVLKADRTAELWLDTAAVSLQCLLKRSVESGAAIFENDVADVIGMKFPAVSFAPTDRIVCVFRAGWRFALAFDFNPDGKLDIDAFTRTLGALFRNLRYRHQYDALADQELFDGLVASGWFPFAEIVTTEFRELLMHAGAGFDRAEIEATLLSKFDADRTDRVFERWMTKPHYAAKEALLRAAIDAFNRKEPVAVIKILLTEIEGILNDAYRATHGGQGAKLKALLAFAVESAEAKVGQPDTLLFSEAFARYLSTYTFANFDPVAQTGDAGSRHPVAHGAAEAGTYTMTRALQAILTLDQFAFYT